MKNSKKVKKVKTSPKPNKPNKPNNSQEQFPTFEQVSIAMSIVTVAIMLWLFWFI